VQVGRGVFGGVSRIPKRHGNKNANVLEGARLEGFEVERIKVGFAYWV
jgi:hypothetical protein